MKLEPVKSTSIAGRHYDPATQVLCVRYMSGNKPGKVYAYKGVTAEQFDGFKNAKSAGRWVASNLIGQHEHSVIDYKED